jgi:hypothetical protein
MTGSNRVNRGGNWNNNLNNARSANRNNNNPDNRNNNIGFRLSSSPPGPMAAVHGRPPSAMVVTHALPSRPGMGPNSPAAGHGTTLCRPGGTLPRSPLPILSSFRPEVPMRLNSVSPAGPALILLAGMLAFAGIASADTGISNTFAIDLRTGTVAPAPNLTPYQPPGWSDKIVVATAAGVTTDSSRLIPSDTLYVSWAAINNGGVSIPASPNYWFYLYLDGSLWAPNFYTDFALNPNAYLYAPGFPLGSLSQGTHTLRLVCDATNVVTESNEADNEYTKTITVGAAARFFTATPCRVLDTRNPTGPLGAPPLQPGATRTFDPSASTCVIPADAVAISANLTVTNVGALGELVVFPADVLRPNTSALSFRAGRTRANNAIVSFSKSSTTFSVFNNSATSVDFILDVNGFFR